MNDGNFIKNKNDKAQNDDKSNENFEKRKICEKYEEINQLYERMLFKNIDKRYNDEITTFKSCKPLLARSLS